MAIDPAARRAEGVSPLPDSVRTGARGKDGKGVNLPEASYRNPCPTENLRGVEANTSLDAASNFAEPFTTQTFGSEVPRGVPFDTPDSSGRLAAPTSNSVRNTADSSARNSHVYVMPPDSFSDIGESYPANGGLDGES